MAYVHRTLEQKIMDISRDYSVSAQYVAYLEYFDVDDVISNLIGDLLGFLCYKWFGDKLNIWQTSLLIIVIGITGCVFTRGTTIVYETQFDFDIESVVIEENNISIKGICDIYQRDTVPYHIILKNQGETYTAKTEISGNQFSAAVPDTNGELYVQFTGYQPIATHVYINNSTVNYVPSNTKAPDLANTDLKFIDDGGN